MKSLGGKEYYLLFKKLFSHEERIYFLKHKSEAFEHYKKYEAWLTVQRKGRVRILGCDRGGEFTSKQFSDHLEKSGAIRHLTVHDSPLSHQLLMALSESNGLIEHIWMASANFDFSHSEP